jgi:hypothetical protein
MLVKLLPDILDRVDIFVMEVEELQIPKVLTDGTTDTLTFVFSLDFKASVIVKLQPLKWEYWWCVSLPVAFVGLSSIRRNNIQSLQVFLGGVIANGVLPVLYAMYYYFPDAYRYVQTRSVKNIQTWQVITKTRIWNWILVSRNSYCVVIVFKLVNTCVFQGYPYGLLWYAFLFVAIQVHGASVLFASKLVKAWSQKGSTPAKKAN